MVNPKSSINGAYDSRLYVERSETDDLLDWINKSQEKQLCALIGPPCSGKTWTINHLLQSCLANSPLYVIIKIPIDQIVTENKTLDEAALGKIFRDFYTANIRKFNLRPLTPFNQLANLIAELVEQICNGTTKPILVIDEYDKLNEEAAKGLCLFIFEHFLSRSCTRILVGCREFSQIFGYSVNKNKKSLLLKSEIDWKIQLRILRSSYNISTSDTQIANWQSGLKHYRWNHPAINYFMLIQENSKTDPFTKQDLDNLNECVMKLLEHAEYSSINDDTLLLLKNIAQFQFKSGGCMWPMGLMLEEVSNVMGEVFKQGNERIQRLHNYRLIEHIGDDHFMVTQGLYEILCDVHDLEKDKI